MTEELHAAVERLRALRDNMRNTDWELVDDPGYECGNCDATHEEAYLVREKIGGGGVAIILYDANETHHGKLIVESHNALPSILSHLDALAKQVEGLEQERDEATAQVAVCVEAMEEAASGAGKDWLQLQLILAHTLINLPAAAKTLTAENARLKEALDAALHDLETSVGLYASDKADGSNLFVLEHPSIAKVLNVLHPAALNGGANG